MKHDVARLYIRNQTVGGSFATSAVGSGSEEIRAKVGTIGDFHPIDL
jgi:hypothetical protein